MDKIHHVTLQILNVSDRVFDSSPMTFSYFDEVLTVKFAVCSRSAYGMLIRGVDGRTDENSRNLGEEYEKIEMKENKKEK